MTTRQSTSLFSTSMPASALRIRGMPSKVKGLVTMATVRIPMSRATLAMTGAAPVPVPPPMPAAMKTMSAPFKASRILSRSSSAAWRPTSGLEPAPMPRVVLTPSCSLFWMGFSCRTCLSVLATMSSTPCRSKSIICFKALHPPPPMPMTLIMTGDVLSVSSICIVKAMFYLLCASEPMCDALG